MHPSTTRRGTDRSKAKGRTGSKISSVFLCILLFFLYYFYANLISLFVLKNFLFSLAHFSPAGAMPHLACYS